MTPPTRDPARPVPLDTEPSARLGEVLRLLDDVAAITGQADAATVATVDGLIRRGLLASGPDGVGRLGVTDAGAAVLEQVEGVQVRLLDTLVGELGEVGVAGFRATLQAIASVANTVGGHTGRLA